MSLTFRETSIRELRERERAADELARGQKLLSAQVGAASGRQDFIEDCIAEMAGQVYSV